MAPRVNEQVRSKSTFGCRPLNLTIAGFHDKVPSNAYMRYLADRTDEPVLTSRTPTNVAFPP